MTSSSSKIFNVEDVSSVPGAQHSALDTTVVEAEINAPNSEVAREIERNAEKEKEVAQQTASVAKSLGSDYTGEPSTAVGEFEVSAARKTNAAVAEGKHDVAEVKATGASYVEQAKAFAASAIETAQSYFPESIGGRAHAQSTTTESAQPKEEGRTGAGIITSVEATAENVYHKVSAVAQPHIEHVHEVAHPRIEHVKGVVEGYMGTSGTQGKGTDSPDKPSEDKKFSAASSAPLESGSHTVDAPYPDKSSQVKATDVAASGAQPSIHN
ncbi:hypothetical protein BDN70DRAFT_880458 [Pholiota conissans]|uniref:Uncharacterized protein n=1 Tax=Pholiota conissans TaxID=109636 RepID=A0A9P6CZ60_9AGAR|nr:hypothetical protein BDN70DRAFT_880458 [Pholiota conissans]